LNNEGLTVKDVTGIKRHNNNRSTFTKGKGPWEIVITRSCSSKSEAYNLELKLKAFKDSALAVKYLQSL
jgi:predicted GIY-YIG superfamily endonuclease